ncbi:transketolase family protein [Actinotalea sp. M2MS4P-6]|uniref:transketolase family protein n=1 Tax=Actinotalea sp. M2MS4P-6 TaxID=2983762 RepID=UPI0021E41305|nr:transketolase C-terminal domain-containing protein [Actinotalea sp. M2MS4P-6]MCV2395659.1 transketolase family protein [Actinotalea sp. M2MS4P-6]
MTVLVDPRATFGAAVTEVAAHDPRVAVVSTDSGGSSGFGDFARLYPERYLEVGILEQGATGVAAGLATTGAVPVFCAIAPFVTCRNFEAVRNDLGYMRQNVKVVGRNGGLTYADLGPTHHSLEDYALMRMIPGMVVLAPQDAGEIRGAVRAMLEHDGPVYMRIGGPAVPSLFADDDFEIGRARHLRTGEDLTVVSTGYVTPAVLEAVDGLASEGIAADLLGLGTVEPLDQEAILASALRTGVVVTVEEHYVRGGLGGAVSELLAEVPGVQVHRIGVRHGYVSTGRYVELLAAAGLDAPGLTSRIREIAHGGR